MTLNLPAPSPPAPIGPVGLQHPEFDAARIVIETDRLNLRGKSLVSMGDLNRRQTLGILRVAEALDLAHQQGFQLFRYRYPRSLAMIFEKPSLRTRVTFDLGMRQLGGLTVVLGPLEIGMGVRESVPDVARNLERWVDAIMARVFEHSKLTGLRDYSHVPVINALSDDEHPCQILADLYTIRQVKGAYKGLKLAWVGDGNNVLHSLLLGCALVGVDLVCACPKDHEPDKAVVAKAKQLACESRIEICNDPREAVRNADIVYTDVWVSMGKEEERAQRLKSFVGFQVTNDLMKLAKPDAVFMHDLPAHRGEEVTDEVLDGPQSVAFQQAENRLHAQKAVLALLVGP